MTRSGGRAGGAPVVALAVVADDRTGALEVAGACADAGAGTVAVHALAGASAAAEADGPVVVIDAGTRHAEADVAATMAVAAAAALPAAARAAHKIDSTLRGAWAAELVGRRAGAGGLVLVVPALPALGRTCVAGVVGEHGLPVAETAAARDPRAPVRSSRPAEHLLAAGAGDVAELADAAAVRQWSASGGPQFAVCDASTADDLAAIADVFSSTEGTLLAGTSAAIAAAVVATVDRPATAGPAPAVVAPVLVVCGSVHDVARRQLGALVAVGAQPLVVGERPHEARRALAAGRTVVLATALPPGDVAPGDALAAADALAGSAGELLAGVGTLVVIGGDTAAAVLGPSGVHVGGTLAPGTPWGHRADGTGPLIVTRSGAFGADDALVALVRAG